MHVLPLSIAGFTIRLILHTAHIQQKPAMRLTSLITKYFNNFITTGKTDHIDATINIVDQASYNLQYDKNGTTYIEFFYKTGEIYTTFYHISIYQFFIVIVHVLTMLLSTHGGTNLHASAVLIHNKAVLFLGHTGDGKSTIIKLLKNHATILADDHVIIRKIEGKYVAFQTPYIERESWFAKQSRAFTLDKVYFLKKGKITTARRLSGEERLAKLLENVPFPEHTNKQNLSFIMHFASVENLFFELQFQKRANPLYELLQKHV